MRNAICLFGFLRTFEATANSLLKNVANVNDADIFIFAPRKTGIINKEWEKQTNNDSLVGEQVTESMLHQIYGDRLKKVKLWDYDQDYFDELAQKDKIVEVAQINPSRIFSTFFHIQQSLKLIEEYEKDNNIKYDNIIQTRPDLAFYSPIIIENLDSSVVNIPFSGGHIPEETGNMVGFNAPVFYYKNVELGEFLPAGKYFFNDQVLISSRDNIMVNKEIFDNLLQYNKNGVPFNPETIEFYHMFIKNNLKIESQNYWYYEIFRSNMKIIHNYNNLKISPILQSKLPLKNKIYDMIKKILRSISPLFRVCINAKEKIDLYNNHEIALLYEIKNKIDKIN